MRGDIILSLPSTNNLLYFHVDSSDVCTGCIYIQQIPEGERNISFNSRVFGKAEQKVYTVHRELCGIIYALQTYGQYIIGWPFPINLFCGQILILYLWGRKRQLSHQFLSYQVITTDNN